MQIYGTTTSITYLLFGRIIWSLWMSLAVTKGLAFDGQAGLLSA